MFEILALGRLKFDTPLSRLDERVIGIVVFLELDDQPIDSRVDARQLCLDRRDASLDPSRV